MVLTSGVYMNSGAAKQNFNVMPLGQWHSEPAPASTHVTHTSLQTCDANVIQVSGIPPGPGLAWVVLHENIFCGTRLSLGLVYPVSMVVMDIFLVPHVYPIYWIFQLYVSTRIMVVDTTYINLEPGLLSPFSVPDLSNGFIWSEFNVNLN